MNAITVIRDKFRKIRQISGSHFIFSVLAAFLITGIAVLRLPLKSKILPMIDWIFVFLPTLTILFLFYASIERTKRSVFLFIKFLYYLCSPFILMFICDALFDPNKANTYSENFFSRFFPLWIVIWLFGIIALKALAWLLEFTAKKVFADENPAKKIIYALAIMYTPQKIISKQKKDGKSKWFVAIICMLAVALAVFIFVVTLFLHTVYSNMEFEAILFTVTFAAGGLALEDLVAGFTLVVLFSLITGYICFQLLKCFRNDKLVVEDSGSTGSYTLLLNWKKRAVHIVLSALLLIGSVLLFSRQTDFFHYLNMKSDKSSLYDNYYVAPSESVISFPEKKRNLIYIFLESMENTYASKDIGGSQDIDYISGLSELAFDKDSVNFSNTDKLGGASVFIPAITHTMGSTVAQTSGIPLNTELFDFSKEFPPVKRLEDVLHDNGYNQLYIEGSKGEFSMYDTYVGRYDDSLVYDRITLVEKGYAEEGTDYIWKWGIEDQKLIEITKELITEISQKDKPFFVTMYTMDTHTFESGHRCQNCDDSISNDYLASVECSSRSVIKLVEWIKQQPFYENTTIILVGDHLGNQKTSRVEIDDDYIRTTYNCIINPAKEPANTKNRIFSSLDMFPTTLSAIGVTIKNYRLGLGTDLFSKTPTLCEELGVEVYKEQLERSRDY
ncbi:MAG: sulfatase-like hydrolase/transferase [Lachnospiraceae bacterium]|nr:sulfatase-like hydrolase/transferase [Lachnospiraceae bacterium]